MECLPRVQSAWQQGWLPAGLDNGAKARALLQVHHADDGALEPQEPALAGSRSDLALQSATVTPGGVAGATAQIMLAPLRTASGFLGGGFDLSGSGMATGSVEARIAPLAALPQPFASLESVCELAKELAAVLHLPLPVASRSPTISAAEALADSGASAAAPAQAVADCSARSRFCCRLAPTRRAPARHRPHDAPCPDRGTASPAAGRARAAAPMVALGAPASTATARPPQAPVCLTDSS